MKKNVVLVTGGTGLVGKALQDIIRHTALETKFDWIFVGSFLDLSGDYMFVRNFFELYHPMFVIHLAAKVGGVYHNESNNLKMFQENIKINENIIRACDEFHVEKAVLCLSTCIYPDKVSSYPIHEEMLHDGRPHSSNEGYSYAKRMLEIQARLYNTTPGHKTEFLCVIPTNIYGPHDNFNLETGHVIPSLIHKCYLAKKNGTPFTIRGSGGALRQFIYSQDVAEYIIHVLFTLSPQQIPHGILLVPPEHDEKPIRHIVHEIANAFELPHDKVVFDTNYTDGQYRKTASNHLIQQFFPNIKQVSLELGIKRSVQWFIEHYDEARL